MLHSVLHVKLIFIAVLFCLLCISFCRRQVIPSY